MLRNWAGNVAFGARALREPTSIDEVKREVQDAEACRVVGTGHSFSTVAATTGVLLSLRRMPSWLTVSAGTATFSAHMTFADVAHELQAKGLALGNMPSLPHLSVCGAMATATHGSGLRQPVLTAALVEVTYVSGDGVVRKAGPDAVLLGAAGAITTVTLRVVPTFAMRQAVYGPVPWTLVDDHLVELMGAAYSASLFTDYGPGGCHQLWLKSRLEDPPPSTFGLPRLDGQQHPAGLDGSNCTEQGDRPGPWHERLPHFRHDRPPSHAGDELHSEWFVPLDKAVLAIRALREMRATIQPVIWVSEVRAVAADDLCLSPCCGRACIAIQFTWKPDEDAVRRTIPLVEAKLRPLGMLPHWGKLTSMTPAQLAAAYVNGTHGDRVRELMTVLRREDPQRKFASEHLRCLLDAAWTEANSPVSR